MGLVDVMDKIMLTTPSCLTFTYQNGLFLTLHLGTSGARNENLRPLLNTNIPPINGKYGQKPLLTTGKWVIGFS